MNTQYASKANEVLTKGQANKDNRNVGAYLLNSKINTHTIISFHLLTQIKRDSSARYKFYDALSMWLRQWPSWSSKDLDYLMTLANEYLSS